MLKFVQKSDATHSFSQRLHSDFDGSLGSSISHHAAVAAKITGQKLLKGVDVSFRVAAGSRRWCARRQATNAGDSAFSLASLKKQALVALLMTSIS